MLKVSRTTITRWEDGHREIDERLLPRVVAATGIPAKKLRLDWAALLEAAE